MPLVSLPSAWALSFSVLKLLYEENKVEASDKWSQILRAIVASNHLGYFKSTGGSNVSFQS